MLIRVDLCSSVATPELAHAAKTLTVSSTKVVIKENYGSDKRTLKAITVMYRSEGHDPQHNDWYWVKYNPDGSPAQAPPEMGSMRLAGRVTGCIHCHQDAAVNDFAFIND